jgi:microcin C transport system ATP-binding protein
VSLLEVRGLSVAFGGSEVVHDVSFTVAPGETLALVGESGSGKSVTALSILQLLPYPAAQHPSGSILLEGQEMVGADRRTLMRMRGNRAAMVFQEPMTSLNPVHSIGRQITEVLHLHRPMGKAEARSRAIDLLMLVGLNNAAQRIDAYPHELSGGQRQRVMIAMALACEPALLIADEPTTALDVTIQAQILQLLKDLQARLGMAILLITHDLGIVRRVADRVCVMTQGRIVEQGPVVDIFGQPQHDYTKKLLAAEPKGQPNAAPPATAPILTARDMRVWFPIKGGLLRRAKDHVKAVDGIDLEVRPGETLGIVGESGSGKSTLGYALLRLTGVTGGTVTFMGRDLLSLPVPELRALRRDVQIVFQDPYGSLSPRLSVFEIVAEGLSVHGIAPDYDERRRIVAATLAEVGLDAATMDRYPHEFSGGQRQRIAIARAVVLKPKLIVLDEPTSALDMSVQAQIVDLLRELQRRHNLAYIFISHDLKVVRALADRVLVMKDGKVVESGPTARIFDAPETPYARALLAAALNMAPVEAGAVRA